MGVQANEFSATYFQRIGDVKISNSKWEISFHVKWNLPYHSEPPLTKLMKMLPRIISNMEQNDLDSTGQLFTTSKAQIEILRNEIQELLNSIIDIYNVHEDDSIGKIKKRAALFPFMSDALNFVFGTAKQSTVDKANRRIKKLQETNNKVIHLMDDQLSLINITHQTTKNNVRQIKQLQSAMTMLSGNFSEWSMNIYTQNYVNIVIHSLENLVGALRSYENSIRILHNRKLPPHIIRPSQLKKVLSELSHILRGRFSLPFPIKKLAAYYDTLPIEFHLEKHIQTIILYIPLVQSNQNFLLYKITSIPVPYNDTPLWAQYLIPEERFLLSTEGDIYVPMTNADMAKCIISENVICEIKKPLWKVSHSRLPCFLCLFFKTVDIQKTCQKDIFSINTPILAVRKDRDTWWVSTQSDTQFILVCSKQADFQSTVKNLQRGLHEIPAFPQCMWKNKFLQLSTGGILHNKNIEIPDNSKSIDFLFPKFQVPQFQKQIFNDNIYTSEAVWNYNFLKNKINQENLKKNNFDISINKKSSIFSLAFIIFLTILIIIGIFVCLKFRVKIMTWLTLKRENQHPAQEQTPVTNIYPILPCCEGIPPRTPGPTLNSF